MTALARAMPQRRGACPGLSRPMPTGDGLLVRLMPTSTIPLLAFSELCAAARRHGNGIIEVTSRGSIQVRGLREDSAPRFATEIAALAIAADDGVPIHCNPLAGSDADEMLDASVLDAALRRALAQQPLGKLNAKVSVAIDGGGQLDIAGLSADICLRSQMLNGGVAFDVGVGGDAASATHVGTVSSAHSVAAALQLLALVARHGPDARARTVLTTAGLDPFRAAIAELLTADGQPPASQPSREAIGIHRLHEGSLACGIGLGFGHADAASLERLTDAARKAGASGLRIAPGRILLAIGLAPPTVQNFVAAAAHLGFVTRPDDPRRRVVACAGAPICASAHIASRAIAPRIADLVATHGPDAPTIHISGCAKGCAHAAPAALTIVGTAEGCALIADARPSDSPFAVVSTQELPNVVTQFIRRTVREVSHV